MTPEGLPVEDSGTRGSVLLDTHTLVWLMQGNERLGPVARATIEQGAASETGVLIAAISIWEIGMLVAQGRLTLDRDVGEWVDLALAQPGLRLAPLEPSIAVSATRLPAEIHGNPADRLIVATGRHLGATVVTDDRLILDYAALGHIRALRAGA